MLDAEFAIRVDFIGLDFQMTAQRFDDGVRSGSSAHR
jgi:hypothetical protein